MNYVTDYPRAPGAESLDDQGPCGLKDIARLTAHSMAAVYKWAQWEKLPAANGPKVNDKETWLRPTILAWAYRRGFTVDKRGVPCEAHAEAARWAEVEPETPDVCDTEQSRHKNR